MLRANAPLLPVSLANKILKYYRRSTIVLYSLGAGTASTGGRSHTDLASVWADLVLPTVETFQGLLALVSAHNSALLSYNQHGLTPVLWRELQGPHWLGPRWQKYYKSTTKFGHFFFFPTSVRLVGQPHWDQQWHHSRMLTIFRLKQQKVVRSGWDSI